jgi:protein phosphatase
MPESTTLKLLTAARSDPGRDPNKQINEDAYHLFENREGLLVVVCDGMGGHLGGNLASNIAVKSVDLDFRTWGLGNEPQRLLTESIQRAAAKVYELGGTTAATERPGTTCVAAWLSNQGLYVAHVGDSRAYRYRNGTLFRLTVDHTVVEAWVASGQLTREQAKGHPDAHRITRALGIAPTVEVELRPVEDVRARDRLLFCSDGLTDLVADEELAQWLASPHTLDTIAENLVNLANQRGGHDNITVVLVEVVETANALETTQAGTVLGLSLPLPKTVSIDAVNQRTILMGEPSLLAGPLGKEPAAERNEKTLPLQRNDLPQPQTPRRQGDSYFPQSSKHQRHRARRQLWLALGLGVLLSVLAILVRLLRHRNG